MNSGFLLSTSNYKKILQKVVKWGGKLDLHLCRIRQLDNDLQNTLKNQTKLLESWAIPHFLEGCIMGSFHHNFCLHVCFSKLFPHKWK